MKLWRIIRLKSRCFFVPLPFPPHFDSNWTLWNFFLQNNVTKKSCERKYIKAGLGRKTILYWLLHKGDIFLIYTHCLSTRWSLDFWERKKLSVGLILCWKSCSLNVGRCFVVHISRDRIKQFAQCWTKCQTFGDSKSEKLEWVLTGATGALCQQSQKLSVQIKSLVNGYFVHL